MATSKKRGRKPSKPRPIGTTREPGPGEEVVFCKAFFHKAAKRMIVAEPGRCFRFVVKSKSAQ